MAFTSDYSTTALATLLDGAVSGTDLADILNQHPNGAVVEIDPLSPPVQALTQIPDSSGHDPTIALLENAGELIDTVNFSNLHTVIQEDADYTATQLTLFGGGNLHVYLQPVISGGNYIIQDNMNGGKLVVSGNDANIEVNLAYAGTHYGTDQTIVAKDGSNVVDIGSGHAPVEIDGVIATAQLHR
jgi:hypothetical protein